MKIGLVGCGGRGTGAAEDCLKSAPDVQLVALADMFEDRLKSSREYLEKTKHAGVKIEHIFTGFDAYKRLLEHVDLVLLCTPPGFRPMHFEAAVEAGKHVFMEKPVAVDPAGVRRVIEAGKKAAEKKLGVVSGTQYRHHKAFIETIRRVHEGAIGTILQGRAYYNTGPLWRHDRKPGQSDMEWQLRNWYYFDWLSGDHIVEQHIHTIDVTDWAMNARPLRASAIGGRQVRTGDEHGNIWDHFCVDYEYPGGVHVMSMTRQMPGAGYVGAHFVGTLGTAAPYRGEITGPNRWKFEGNAGALGPAYVQEHRDLIESIRAGKPLNESEQVALSSLTAILGREAAYTGKTVSWDEMLKSSLDFSPPKYDFGPLAVRPVPVPGKKR